MEKWKINHRRKYWISRKRNNFLCIEASSFDHNKTGKCGKEHPTWKAHRKMYRFEINFAILFSSKRKKIDPNNMNDKIGVLQRSKRKLKEENGWKSLGKVSVCYVNPIVLLVAMWVCSFFSWFRFSLTFFFSCFLFEFVLFAFRLCAFHVCFCMCLYF